MKSAHLSGELGHHLRMGGEPLVLVWRVTERCDTACPFCAYDVTLRRSRREAAADEVLRLGGLAAVWAAARGRGLLVAWLGGEPFLWPPLAEVSRELRGRGARIALTSNGRPLRDERWRRWAGESLDELTLSLDGPPGIHDRLRGRGSSAGVLAALRDLRARAPRPLLRVNTVLMRGSVGRFAELCAEVEHAGADELTFNALGGRDRPDFFPAHALRPEDVADFAVELARARRAGRLRIRGADGYLARIGAAAAGTPSPVADCAPGRDLWLIEVDGRLAPCGFVDAALPIAALRLPADLDRISDELAARRARARPPACTDCPSTQVHRKWDPR